MNWTLSSSYNPDIELGWSNINSTVQARIPTLFNIDISMTHAPYRQEYNEALQTYESINKFEPFPRLTYMSASTDIGFNGNKFNYNNSNPVIDSPDTLDFDEKIDLSQSLDPYEPIIESGRVWDMGLRLHYTLRSYSDEEQIRWDKTIWANIK